MKLSNLLSGFVTILPHQDCDVFGLCLDSREVKPGFVFFACQGALQDGRSFIQHAFEHGAVAVVSDTGPGFEHERYLREGEHKRFFGIANLPRLLGPIAARFYRQPSASLHVVGITGTNGKTSSSHFISEAVATLGQPAGVIGTLGAGMIGEPLEATLNTTPNAIAVQALLAQFLERGAMLVAMEVSSHGLAQDRVEGVQFETAVFTNLSRDHLDYHGSMSEYGASKQRLLEWPNLKYAIINVDDPFGKQLLECVARSVTLIGYSKVGDRDLAGRCPLVVAEKASFTVQGIEAEVATPWGLGTLRTHLLGSFNLSNLLAATAVLCLQGIPLEKVLAALSRSSTVPGRLERFGGDGKLPLAIVDYAHTPDALDQVLSALREHCLGELWCVFGCGGERDKGKRPLMAKSVEKWADHLVVTDDNPRSEDPEQIVADLMKGFYKPQGVLVEHDRKIAIQKALLTAKAGDIVLIAGKGHEQYQHIKTHKLPFSDVEVVRQTLAGLFCSEENG